MNKWRSICCSGEKEPARHGLASMDQAHKKRQQLARKWCEIQRRRQRQERQPRTQRPTQPQPKQAAKNKCVEPTKTALLKKERRALWKERKTLVGSNKSLSSKSGKGRQTDSWMSSPGS